MYSIAVVQTILWNHVETRIHSYLQFALNTNSTSFSPVWTAIWFSMIVCNYEKCIQNNYFWKWNFLCFVSTRASLTVIHEKNTKSQLTSTLNVVTFPCAPVNGLLFNWSIDTNTEASIQCVSHLCGYEQMNLFIVHVHFVSLIWMFEAELTFTIAICICERMAFASSFRVSLHRTHKRQAYRCSWILWWFTPIACSVLRIFSLLHHCSNSRHCLVRIMAKRFSPETDKWAVKISIDKKKSRSLTRSPLRQNMIRNLRSSNNNRASQVKFIVNFLHLVSLFLLIWWFGLGIARWLDEINSRLKNRNWMSSKLFNWIGEKLATQIE